MISLDIPSFTIPDFPFLPHECQGVSAVYCRVSGQDDPRIASLGTQAQACIARALENRHSLVPESVYFERQTGFQSEDERPKLIEIKRRIQAGEIQALYVYATDRLSRSDDLKFIVRWMERRRCKVHFITFERQEGHVGDFMLDVMAFASTNERVSIIDRTQRGRDTVKELGRMLGCGPCRYGYKWSDDGLRNRVRDPETAWVVELIFGLVGNQGWSTIQVAKHFKARGIPSPYMTRANRRTNRVTEWTPQRVGFICRERSYLGLSLEKRSVPVLDENGEKVKVGRIGKKRTKRRLVDPGEFLAASNSTTEALVDRDLFDRCRAALKQRIKKGDRTRNAKDFWLLRGLTLCASCGYKMTPHYSNTTKAQGTRPYYRCNTRSATYARPRRDCMAPMIRQDDLEPRVWDAIEGLIRSPGVVAKALDEAARDGNADLLASELAEVGKDLLAAEKRKDHLTELYKETKNATLRGSIQSEVDQLERDLIALAARKASLASRLAPYRDMDKTKAAVLEMVAQFNARMADPDYLTPAQKRQIIEALAIQVVATSATEFTLRMRPPVAVPSVVLESITSIKFQNNTTAAFTLAFRAADLFPGQSQRNSRLTQLAVSGSCDSPA